jgi:hypothetical protein
LEKDIKELENNLLNYEQRRKNLLDAMEMGEFNKDEILDRLNKIKILQPEDEVRLKDLLKTREHLASLENAKVKIDELYHTMMDNLENPTSEIKVLAFDALDIKIYVKDINDIEIQGVIPLELASSTTAQTSALPRANSCPSRPA